MNLPPSSHSPWIFYCWSWYHMVWNILLSCLCVLPTPRISPACLLGGPKWGREGLEALQSSAITKRLVCYQHCFSHKSKPQYHTGYYEENEFHPGQNQCNFQPLLHTLCLVFRKYTIQYVLINHHLPIAIPWHIHRYHSLSLHVTPGSVYHSPQLYITDRYRMLTNMGLHTSLLNSSSMSNFMQNNSAFNLQNLHS